MIAEHLTFAGPTPGGSRQRLSKIPFLVERPEVCHCKRVVIHRPYKWSPNIADASNRRATEDTPGGFFSKVHTNARNGGPICLVDMSLLSTNECGFSFEDQKGDADPDLGWGDRHDSTILTFTRPFANRIIKYRNRLCSPLIAQHPVRNKDQRNPQKINLLHSFGRRDSTRPLSNSRHSTVPAPRPPRPFLRRVPIPPLPQILPFPISTPSLLAER
jgi:hypothetical protein